MEPWHFCRPCFDNDHDACTGRCARFDDCARPCECAGWEHMHPEDYGSKDFLTDPAQSDGSGA